MSGSEAESEARCVNTIPSNHTELARRPRENTAAEHERLEGPYQRLQARYGGWHNRAASATCSTLTAVLLVILNTVLNQNVV